VFIEEKVKRGKGKNSHFQNIHVSNYGNWQKSRTNCSARFGAPTCLFSGGFAVFMGEVVELVHLGCFEV